MTSDELYAVTGGAAVAAATCLALAVLWGRRPSGPAARALALCAALWFARYGLRLMDYADRRVTLFGDALGDPRLLAASTALLAASALLYAIEQRGAP